MSINVKAIEHIIDALSTEYWQNWYHHNEMMRDIKAVMASTVHFSDIGGNVYFRDDMTLSGFSLVVNGKEYKGSDYLGLYFGLDENSAHYIYELLRESSYLRANDLIKIFHELKSNHDDLPYMLDFICRKNCIALINKAKRL